MLHSSILTYYVKSTFSAWVSTETKEQTFHCNWIAVKIDYSENPFW